MSAQYAILVVDDEESICRLLQKELATKERSIHITLSGKEALALCTEQSFHLILLDIRLNDYNGLELLPLLQQRLPAAKIIMMTGYADVDVAVTAMRNGAYDFIAKPFTLEKLDLIVSRALEHAQLERENKLLRLSALRQDQPLIGESPALLQVRYLIEKVAPTNVPVLITGESGTGKDVVATAIHQASGRANLPFVVKNCASLQPELARSELFGHTKGAFTHAITAEEGLLSVAHKGTLFLDEVGELSLDVQSQLLRVLETQRYRRVGDKEERMADVRFLFATNRNLAHEVQEKRFHEALYHRINVFQITLPTLQERAKDIALLVKHFVAMLTPHTPIAITPETMEYLLQYHWPGNIRELRNVIERGIILAEQGQMTPQSLPRELLDANPPTQNTHEPVSPPFSEGVKEQPHTPSLKHLEAEHIKETLLLAGGNKQEAAKKLGISRKTLYRKIEKFNITC